MDKRQDSDADLKKAELAKKTELAKKAELAALDYINLSRAELAALDYIIARAEESGKDVLGPDDLAGSWHIRFIVNLRHRAGAERIEDIPVEKLRRLFSEVPSENLTLRELVALRNRIQEIQ